MFTLSTAAYAAGVPTHTIMTWLDRGTVRLRAVDVEADGSGSRRRYSRQRVMQFAIIAELGSLGIRHGLAASHALEFTDRSAADREPCSLYPDSETLLVIADGRPSVTKAHSSTTVSELVTDQFGTRSMTLITLDLRQLVARVDRCLADAPRTIERKDFAP